MQHAHQSQHASLDTIRTDFMDVYFEIHKQETETKKKSKAKKRFEARRAIEEHQEKKRLQAALKDCWDDI